MRCVDVFTSCSEPVFSHRTTLKVLSFTRTPLHSCSCLLHLLQPGRGRIAYNVSDPLFTIPRRSYCRSAMSLGREIEVLASCSFPISCAFAPSPCFSRVHLSWLHRLLPSPATSSNTRFPPRHRKLSSQPT